jgi:Family of unknown function (DUF5947)
MAAKEFRASDNAFGVLCQFARPRRNVEHCELCSAELAQEHPHLLEPVGRQVLCACDACALLFSGRAGAKFKRVPRNVRQLVNFRMTDAQWDSLTIPINMAFFFRSSSEGRMIAMYPSPAGAMESLLSLDTWSEIARENPELRAMEADVEALLVNRIGHARGFSEPEYYLLPIDECFKLVGLIRLHWKGFSGGTEVWEQIAYFFDKLKAKAMVPAGGAHA